MVEQSRNRPHRRRPDALDRELTPLRVAAKAPNPDRSTAGRAANWTQHLFRGRPKAPEIAKRSQLSRLAVKDRRDTLYA